MEDFLTELNKAQLDRGLDANGAFLGSYAPLTYDIAEKAGRPKTQSEINLLDTGSFRSAFLASVIGNQLIIDSGDWKLPLLERRFGENILGLPIDKKQLVGDRFIEILTIKVTNLLTNA